MAMWARRRIQRMLEENSGFASQSRLHDWVQRLNTISDDYVATEWEIGLLNAFASLGTLRHEPALGDKRIDLVFSNPERQLAFAADIATVSDHQLHRENPVEAFWEELRIRVKKAGVRTGGFSFHVAEKQQPIYLGSGNQRSLLLPPVAAFGTHIFNADWENFLGLVRIQPEKEQQYTARSEDPGVQVTIVYHPGRFGVFQGQHGSYTGATVIDDNPLFNALKAKARQLKGSGYNGPTGIIVADGGCRMLTSWGDWSTYRMEQVVREFFRQHTSVDFVAVIRIKQNSDSGRNQHVYDAQCFGSRHARLAANDLGRLIADAVRRLPAIQQTPDNAVRSMKWEKRGKYGPLGGWSMGGNKIKISTRDLLGLMAGRLDQNQFVERFKVGDTSVFELRLRRGELIREARVEHTPEEDDDWIVFEFGEPDSAVAPFSEPKSKAGS